MQLFTATANDAQHANPLGVSMSKRKRDRNAGSADACAATVRKRSQLPKPVGAANPAKVHNRATETCSEAVIDGVQLRLALPEVADAPSRRLDRRAFVSRNVTQTAARALSGRIWVGRFPGSKRVADCVEPFRNGLQRFLVALRIAGADVVIASTLRPPERAHLMHWAWRIAAGRVQPQDVPAMPGVDIRWLHVDDEGIPDVPGSRNAAREMVEGFGIVAQPALASRHTQGRAVDMAIRWVGKLRMRDVDGSERIIASVPRTGMNSDLHACAATYGVVKAAFAGDPPHWSDDGR